MTEPIDLTQKNFDTEVLSCQVPVLVDFWAEWCGPCKILTPTIDAVAQAYEGKIKVMKLNVDTAPDIAARYGISGIPALYLFNNGKVIDSIVGVQPKEKIEEMLTKVL